MRQLISLIALIFVACSPVNNSNNDTETAAYTDISADSLLSIIADFDGIFDVSPYFDAGHLPYSSDANGVAGLQEMASTLDINGKYLVYCHADGPSIQGANALVSAGLVNVYRLEGNFTAWDAISYLDIGPDQVKTVMDAGGYDAIFDVSPHYDDGHLPDATDAYGNLAEVAAAFDKEGTYLVYCHSDGPSRAGAQQLEDAGFSNVYRLEGNYSAWISAGFSIE